MKVEITYIYNNCFVVKFPDRVFLFDYPDDNFINREIRQQVAAKIEGSNLFIFTSHGHRDHFNPKMTQLGEQAASVTYILSHDILKSHLKLGNLPSAVVTGPNQSYRVNDLEITTFESNDLGVAFLIHSDQFNIYHGGDLANWIWEEDTVQEQQRMGSYFQAALQKLGQGKVRIAFSNTDQRLANWAGAWEFIEKVKPALFIPMHAFGDTQSLLKFKSEISKTDTEIFFYSRSGDTMVYDI
jgi:L-ascorbate metabolism protein UlaG (beta-lactamase superfamily)